jgi:hypothetical protein
MTNQEKDRHVLASAVLSGAKVLVTKNIKDFPPHSVAPYGIEVQNPDEFLVHLYHLDQNHMVQIIWNRHRVYEYFDYCTTRGSQLLHNSFHDLSTKSP